MKKSTAFYAFAFITVFASSFTYSFYDEDDFYNDNSTPPFLEAIEQGNLEQFKNYLKEGIKVDKYTTRNISINEQWKLYPEDLTSVTDTPLLCAIRHNQEHIVDWLLANGADVHCRGNIGETPLNLAVYPGNQKYIDKLISAGADINQKDDNGMTALFYLIEEWSEDCSQEDYPVVFDLAKKFIDQGADLTIVSDEGYNIMFLAAGCAQLDILKYLYHLGLDVNIRVQGIGLLEIATFDEIDREDVNPQRIETIKWLIRQGLKINPRFSKAVKYIMSCKDHELDDLLHQKDVLGQYDVAQDWDREETEFMIQELCEKGKLRKIKKIAKKGYDLKTFDDRKKTTLMYAVRSGNIKLVSWLLDYGFQINEKDKNGETVLEEAAQYSTPEMIQFLVQRGAKTDQRGCSLSEWLLGFSLVGCNLKVLKWLSKKVDVLAPMKIFTDNTKPICFLLSVATNAQVAGIGIPSMQSRYEVFKWLVSQGADINDKLDCGTTLLHLAAGHAQDKIVKFMIDHGIKFHENDNGFNALDFAVLHGDWKGFIDSDMYFRIVDMLLAKGVSVSDKCLKFAQHPNPLGLSDDHLLKIEIDTMNKKILQHAAHQK